MSATTVNTVTGRVAIDDLGQTLMHEHVMVGFPAWEANSLESARDPRELTAICYDRIQELQSRGIRSMVDPCPNDLGRDVAFSAEIAARTGFNIICATGLYTEAHGGSAYWKARGMFGPLRDMMAELFIRELTVGIPPAGIKAGIIKIACGAHTITEYERTVMAAAAIASIETGAPITTHTDLGTMGDAQQKFLIEHGVAPHKIIIGHSCGTADHAYHMRILDGGSYLGFDRFGYNFEGAGTDEERIPALLALLARNRERQIVLSHDSVWCDRGRLVPEAALARLTGKIYPKPTYLTDTIIPLLVAYGATAEQIRTMLVENPKRYFSGLPMAA